jgi:hypothetical protein
LRDRMEYYTPGWTAPAAGLRKANDGPEAGKVTICDFAEVNMDFQVSGGGCQAIEEHGVA